ncbi:thermonuclease family protein [Candidatus Daviesbacteria bacterium]|nr:thermonuclease family protein [Candidatus Daviesbacteria bacterium]
MNGLFVLLFIISLILFPIAVIKPSFVAKVTKHTFTRLRIGSLLGIVTLALFILVGVTAPPKSTNNISVSQDQQVKEASKQQVGVNVEDKSKEPEKASPTPASSSQTNLYTVTSVIDGDTVKVTLGSEQETLRLIGIDSPETVDPRKPVQCFGKEASAKAKALLSGKSVRLEADPTQGERDKYQRLLRYVFLEDGTSFNKLMISEGYAHEYTYNVPYKYQAEFKQAQKEAEANKRGLWADDACGRPQPTTNVSSSGNTGASGGSSGNSGGFTCAGKTLCGQMTSCAEANFYLNTCGISRLDGDKDGVPCETLCN